MARMTESRDERLAHNEVIFRTVNENIAGLATNLGRDAVYEFICECASTDCFERLSMTLGEYERVREDGARFLLTSGHEDLHVELVVETHDGYVVVEKDGQAGVVAEWENPRG